MAKLFDGVSTVPKIIEVSLKGKVLYLDDVPVTLDKVAISFISPTEINLTIGKLSLELTKDDQSFNEVYQVVGKKKEKNLKKGFIFAILAMVMVLISFFTVSLVSEQLPDKYFKLMVKEDFLVNLFPGTCTLQPELNKEILSAIGEKDLRFYIIKLPSINALAYPFDQIFITEDMLFSLRNDHELFAVLGHESGHLKLKHYKGQLARMLFVDVIGSVLDRGQVGKVAETILLNSYSRNHEREADDYSVEVLKRKGYPVHAGATLMQLLKDNVPDFGPAFLNSHPVTAERIAFFRKASAGEKKKPSQDRRLIKKIVKACHVNIK